MHPRDALRPALFAVLALLCSLACVVPVRTAPGVQGRVIDRASGEPLASERAHQLEQLLVRTERILTRDEGLPDREWYRHLIYAPGYYTGYGVKTLPSKLPTA